MKEVVVHIRDKSGERFQKLALGQRTVTVGRAWNSNIILQDKYVSPEHFSIALGEDGVLMLTDLSSTNGTSVDGRSIADEAVAYHLGDVIRVGDTRIQIVDPTKSVEPALIRSGWFLLAEKFRTFPSILVLSAVALLSVVLLNWLFSDSEFGRNDAVSTAFTTLIMMVVWTLVLGFCGKLIRGEGNFRALWILACLAILMFGIVDVSVRVIRFNLQDMILGSATSTVFFSLTSLLILVGVFTYISHLSRAHKWVWSTLIVLSVLGLAKSDDLLKQEHERWTDHSQIDTVTLPKVFIVKPVVGIDEYQRKVEDLFNFETVE